MSDELDLSNQASEEDGVVVYGDGVGIALLGDPGAVERFLKRRGLWASSEPFGLNKLGALVETGSQLTEAVSRIAAESGRYLKLTKESAQNVKEFGLMPTKSPGISHAMLGDPGSIAKWLQIEDNSFSFLTNPALLSGAAGIMMQVARQQEARELKALLVRIDEKLDDVRRRQRDEVLARMDRVALQIESAQRVREHGGDRETVWAKLLPEAGTLAQVQTDALRALEALADKVDAKATVGGLSKALKEIEREVAVWLAVLSRCFQLQDDYAVIELEHVLETAPSALEGHRLGIQHDLSDRRDKIVDKSRHLLLRMHEAGGVAQGNVLLHVRAAAAVINSINTVGDSIDEFYAPLGIEPQRRELTRTRWRDAVRDPKQWQNAAADAGPKVAVAGLTVGAVVVAAVLKGDDSKGLSDGEA
ncbi:hypothetical protein [Agromyces sp. NBRC 114283]|uniref:hypothetical protein n=1 Tax=Agromyces sp. NBRC 114283 TaxID=2994521 RepID=UPI0024A4C5EF|nr:hypothetical protein [Agromyces sp. NBRC 114283]GLU91065.1 hypothetical protein Agsp01_33200 [Agromyces sp. NBRC 114283]